MKKIYILFIVLISLKSFSQKDYSRYYNAWRLGLNLGGAWQTADYRSCWGMAGGFTLEKGLGENSTNFFSFAIRGRYLAANTYGMDYNRNYRMKSNDAYNGKYDPAVNFVDSVPVNRQYVFDNYKMTLGEGSLELQLTFNRLRERTHVILNLWGGVGVTSYRTMSDLLDGDKKMYDFSQVDSTGNQTKALNSYNGLIDKNYESYAYGSRNGNLVTFSPSAGVGLGYQFSPGFSILLEYKITLPQGTNADLLDGKLSLNNDRIGGSNDYYHYTGLNFLFTLRGKKKTKSTTPKNETVNTNTTVPTNTTSVPASSVAPTTGNIQPSKGPKPVISFITPPSNAFSVNNQQYKISAQVLNVSASNTIQFKLNGVTRTDFIYNTQTRSLEYNALLNKGTNSVQIIASNSAGTDTKQTSVVYEQLRPGGNPPLVSYINPVQPGTTISSNTYIVLAQVSNVSDKKNISVYFNGMSTPFTFNPVSKQITFSTVLNDGSNSISITANNTLGEDTKVTSIIYKKELPLPPVVNLINPSNAMNNTAKSLYIFKLGVLNVNSKSDIEVLFNGSLQSNFTYDPVSRELIFQTNLSAGNNNLTVKGTNASGSDFKQITVNYTPPVELKSPPLVSINTPSSDGTTIMNPNHTFKATITNVANTTGIKVKFNGNIVTNYTYDGFNLTYPAMLAQGSNQFEVEASNNDGTDAQKRLINFRFIASSGPPQVNLKNPASSESATENGVYNFQVIVLNVTSKSGIQVTINGNSQSNFNYEVSTKEVSFQTNLIVGENIILVQGTNKNGTDFKQIKVTYTPPIEIKRPPSITFINPAIPVTNSKIAYFVYRASIKGIPNANGLVVKYNRAVISNFTYDGSILTYSTTLIPGNNTLEIAIFNSDGNEQKMATVNYKPVEAEKPPIVTIVQPSKTPLVTSPEYYFQFKVLNATKQQIEVKLNGNQITSFNFTSMMGGFAFTLVPGKNILKVTATNSAGIDTKSETVVFRYVKDSVIVPPAGTGTSDEKKITICHIPPGNNQNPQTITIPASAWPAHLAHGDTQGACPSKKDSIKVNKLPGKSLNNNFERGNGTPTVEPNNAPRNPR